MNLSSEENFFRALDICQSLALLKCQLTNLTFEALELFCELAKNPSELIGFLQNYEAETQQASEAVYEYATNAGNWRVNCEIGFGVKDHCTLLSFFLNLPTLKFIAFTGTFNTPEVSGELLKDWKGIDLSSLVVDDLIPVAKNG